MRKPLELKVVVVAEGDATGAAAAVSAVVGEVMLVLLPREKLDNEKEPVPGMLDAAAAGLASAAGSVEAAAEAAGAGAAELEAAAGAGLGGTAAMAFESVERTAAWEIKGIRNKLPSRK